MTDETIAALNRVMRTVSRERDQANDKLTEEQFIEALSQAILSGDFKRLVWLDSGTQAVNYLPYRERKALLARIHELEAEIARLQLPEVKS